MSTTKAMRQCEDEKHTFRMKDRSKNTDNPMVANDSNMSNIFTNPCGFILLPYRINCFLG